MPERNNQSYKITNKGLPKKNGKPFLFIHTLPCGHTLRNPFSTLPKKKEY